MIHTFLASTLLFMLTAFAIAQGPADSNEGSRLSHSSSAGTYSFSWWGTEGRTYFIQHTDDLALAPWAYTPIIESGSNGVISWGATSSASRFFLRLQYTDIPTIDPFNDDFDGDGVSNWDEINQNTHPLSAILDSNGLPLDWEKFYNIAFGIDANMPAPRGDGLTYLQAFEQGLNPNDYYNGQTPIIAKVSGDNQIGAPNGLVPQPLIVSVVDASGQPFIGAPVTFTVTSGVGTVQKSSSSTPAISITALTDSSGQAKAFFKLPATANSTSTITATAGTGSHAASLTFTEESDDGSGSYVSPFAPSKLDIVYNSDGSIDMSWINNADDGYIVPIRMRMPDGSWQQVGSVTAPANSIHIPPQ